MSEAGPDTRPRHDAFAALRQPSFRFFVISRFCSGTGSSLVQAVMLWHVHELTGSALNLALLGLVRFFPVLLVTVLAGAVADTYNRRNIVMAAQSVPLFCCAMLAFATFSGWVTVDLIYGLVLFIGIANAFENPARQALLPGIVPVETFPNAVVVDSNFQTLGAVTGPALTGLIIAVAGSGAGYLTFVVLGCLSITMLSFVRYRQTGSARRINVEMIKEGLRFVKSRQPIFGSMLLDMFAVVFGGAVALFPIYAEDILKVGPTGYGLLAASPEIGAVIMSFVLVLRPPVVRTGRLLMLTVVIFGIGTILFGISRELPLSMLALIIIGGADQVSVVMRRTIVQLATPDELRGRVSAVSQVFVGASNQLGAVESGFVAWLTNATISVVSGGLGTLSVVGLVRVTLPQLWYYETPRGGTPTVVELPAADPTPVTSPGPRVI